MAMIKMVTVSPRPHSGIIGESTRDEAYGVLSGEDRLVQDIMIRKVVTARSAMSVKEVGETIRNQNPPLVVVSEGDDPAHVLTELDLTGDQKNRENTKATDTLQEMIKHRVAVRCHQDAILADAMHAMIQHRTGHIPVLDEKGELVGVLSLVDAVGTLSPPAAERWLAQMRGWSVTPPSSK